MQYYFDWLHYIHTRKLRTEQYKEELRKSNLSIEEMTEKWKEFCGNESAMLRKRRTRTRANDFHILTQVGQGGYGAVYLARKTDTSEVCALKKMSKKLLQKLNEIDHILTERDVLTAANSPWLVKLLYSFQDVEHVYLAMEYVPGGDMRTLLNNSGILREEHTRFYVAEMFMCVNALHQLGFLHRDLKPENFLIDYSGHLKLTDFGLSKGSLSSKHLSTLRSKFEAIKNQKLIYRSSIERRNIHTIRRAENVTWAYSLVGSPDYMAPEILGKDGYDYAVDYWSIGCIMYEFLAGFPPFSAPTMDEVWLNVYRWQEVLERPVYTRPEDLEFNLTDVAWDLITRLITARDRRLASIAEVQIHPFFAGWHFPRMREEVLPPFVPQLDSEFDTSYFDDFSNPQHMAMYKEVNDKKEKLEAQLKSEPVRDAVPRNAFVGFTFRHKQASQLLDGVAKREYVNSSDESSYYRTMF
ncbi:uncharacterized protein VTP21DRAFT_5193 [Calcarisporiella thermophila]|uniref:uncharacterized protein n=1 Tax=Calcarisporiella thermophila TaxID=911321 RepID=UPI0037421CDA